MLLQTSVYMFEDIKFKNGGKECNKREKRKNNDC